MQDLVPRDVSGSRLRLRIMATTDLHMNLTGFDYYTGRPAQNRGLAKAASLVRRARADTANSMLFDNGDFLIGAPPGDALADRARAAGGALPQNHPMIEAMNLLGYDAATLGNHDFDHGLGFLMAALAGADFPFVSANAVFRLGADPTRDETLLPPFTLLEREFIDETGAPWPVVVGVIGFLPPGSIPHFREPGVQARTRDIVETARAYVPAMRAGGADIVVALAHSGIGGDTHSPNMENAVRPLARVPGIDAIIAGHSHQLFPPPSGAAAGIAGGEAPGHVHGVPVVLPGFWGSHLGVVDLALARAEGKWRVELSQVRAEPIFEHGPTGRPRALVRALPSMTRVARPLHEETLARARAPVARTKRAIHSYFAMATPCAATQIVQEAQAARVRELIAGTPYADLPVLSSAAPLKCGGFGGADFFVDLKPGVLTERAMSDLYVYPNDIAALYLTGAGLRDWLERAAAVFRTLVAGVADQPLVAPEAPYYLFETVLGVAYEIDLTAPPRYNVSGQPIPAVPGRVRGLSHRGRPVADTDRFVIATNSHRAAGGGDFPGTGETRIIAAAPESVRHTMTEMLRRQKVIDPVPVEHWRFAAAAGTSARFLTGRGARAHLREDPRLSLSEPAETRDGFLMLRLEL